MGDSPAGLVVGIGVNLLHRAEDFPPDLRATATSLLWPADARWRQNSSRPRSLSALAPWWRKAWKARGLGGPGRSALDPPNRRTLVLATGSGFLRDTFAGVGQDGALLLDGGGASHGA